jgi:hypothetical protein
MVQSLHLLFVVCCPSVRLAVHSVKYGSDMAHRRHVLFDDHDESCFSFQCSITRHDLSILYEVSLVSLPSHKFTRLPYCYYWL